MSGLAVATLVIYTFGIAWLMVSLGLDIIPAIIAGVLPFIIGDTIKAGAAYLIAQKLP
jgi:biotin transport system substrate-specific component